MTTSSSVSPPLEESTTFQNSFLTGGVAFWNVEPKEHEQQLCDSSWVCLEASKPSFRNPKLLGHPSVSGRGKGIAGLTLKKLYIHHESHLLNLFSDVLCQPLKWHDSSSEQKQNQTRVSSYSQFPPPSQQCLRLHLNCFPIVAYTLVIWSKR